MLVSKKVTDLNKIYGEYKNLKKKENKNYIYSNSKTENLSVEKTCKNQQKHGKSSKNLIYVSNI